MEILTFEERLAALGVDLSDLPKEYDDSHVYKYFVEAINFFTEKGKDPSTMSYPLYLVDIIDRMETRLDNVIREREYLLDRMWGENPCVICENAKREGGCAVDICEFEFAGVPEDWRAHDEQS